MLQPRANLFTLEVCKTLVSDALEQIRQKESSLLDQHPIAQWMLVHQCRTTQDELPLHLAVEAVLQEGVAELGRQNEMAEELLDLYYFHQHTIQRIINNRGYIGSVPTIRRRRLDAVEKLGALLFEKEAAAREAWMGENLERLPLAEQTRLFGRNQDIQTLTAHIANSDDHWLINLTGMGGLGKSALAHTTVKQLIRNRRLLHFAWIEMENGAHSADLVYHTVIKRLAQSLLANSGAAFAQLERRVKQTLKTTPYLLIIDNLERLPDGTALAKRLYALTNPTKILLISRHAITAELPILRMRLQSLSLLAAEKYLQTHAAQVGIPALHDATDETLRRIYALIGGHPQALKLFVQLCGYFSLEEVLAEFESTETRDIETLYGDIFGRILAKQSETTQRIMTTMLLAPAVGLPLSQIEAYSGLPKRDYWDALKQLHLASLVESHQRTDQTLHYIHSLTETYLAQHPSPHLHEQITAACHHWRQMDDQTDAAFERDHPFISRLVQVGLRHSQTWHVACQLMDHHFLRIENSGWWYAWLPLYEAAIAAAPDDDPTLLMRLQSQYAFLLDHSGDTARSIELHLAALQTARQHDETKQIGRHHIHLADVFQRVGELVSAEKHARAARDIFTQLGLSNAFQVIANGTLALVAHRAGELTTANRRYAAALHPLDASLPSPMIVRQFNSWGNTLRYLGNWAEARKKYEIALAHAHGRNDRILALIGLCCLHLDAGNLDGAATILAELTIDFDDTSLPPQYAAFIAECSGRYHLFEEETERGVARLNTALTLRKTETRAGVLAETHAWLTAGFILQDDQPNVLAHKRKANHLITATPDRWQSLYHQRFPFLNMGEGHLPNVINTPLKLLIWTNRAGLTTALHNDV